MMIGMDIYTGISGEEATPLPGISLPLPTDYELIQEIISEDERSAGPLPGPPPPPSFPCTTHSHNHRTSRTNSSPASNPVLVPRGTASKPNFNPCHPAEMASSHPSRVPGSSGRDRGSPCSLNSKSSGMSSSQNRADTDMLERILEKPKLVVVEEPKDRGMRFRYECEGRSAGSILGASSTDTNKTQPAIEIQGPIEHLKKVTVTVSLVTKDLPHRPHPHCLVGKDCPNGLGICVVSFNPQNNRRHSFANLGIQCVRRKELDSSLQKRRNLNIDPFQTGHSKGIEDMDMNSVRLCFQCELEWEDGRKDHLSPVVSKPIYDKKATTTSQLKITHLNLFRGPCNGKTEVYMLCDKVQKDDIEIIFRQGSWKANGEFAQTDVHRQIAIVFKTPPYEDQDITEEVKVNVSLRRISDQMESEPVTFTYLPCNRDPYEVKRKRKLKSEMSFPEKPCVTVSAESAPAPEQANHFFSEPQNMISPQEVPHTAQSGIPTLGEQHYCDSLDVNNEEAELFKQLLEMPLLWDVLNNPNFPSVMPCPMDTSNNTFANMDMNFNQSSSSGYVQDFSHYSDVQFSKLVKENQNLQSESQDDMVQVKTEEEL
ncbi:transcription factor RelB homolog isoform X2 [Archocentrus centrarchus]|uniref:transcription factor RelB homolog isoform X2 n=1 Tax=Archocentrus centrarchus TaxID=63155 RepID=UPI0011E9DBE3|nr:transcription factor RelB isoform X2 [Archocentrus centrarchus]